MGYIKVLLALIVFQLMLINIQLDAQSKLQKLESELERIKPRIEEICSPRSHQA